MIGEGGRRGSGGGWPLANRRAWVWAAVRLITAMLLGAPMLTRAQEFRALWADAWRSGFKNAAEIQQLVADARAGHFNAIIAQVRKRGDAYYESSFEPKAAEIAAGFDPLAELIRQAHSGSPRLEVHAWMVTYPIWNSQTPPSRPDHVFNLHPDWLLRNDQGATWDGGNYQLDPGHPGVQEHTFNVAMDIITRYDVDGLQFDYVRYPGNTWGYNAATVSRFNRRSQRSGQPRADDATWLQFRRDQVTALVRKVYLWTMALKPEVKLSAATITWAPGITTDAQWPTTAAYANVLQDWRAWMQEGILDLNVPMAYFRQATHADAWARWSQFVKDHRYRRHAVLGAGIYLNPLASSLAQIRSVRDRTSAGNRADGVACYSYGVSSTDATRTDFLNALTTRSSFDPDPTPVFATAVGPPTMPWKTSPTTGQLMGFVRQAVTGEELDGATVRLTGPASKTLIADATGFYGAVDLAPGDYTATASAAGLVPQTNRLSIAQGRVTAFDFLLPPTLDDAYLAHIRAYPGERAAVITWETADPASSQVQFGLADPPSQSTPADDRPALRHAVLLSGLLPDRAYAFRVISRLGGREYRSSVRSFRTAGQLIVDNLEASFTGSWTLATATTGQYANDYRHAATTTGSATAAATFTPMIETAGNYDIYVWYPPGNGRSTSARFDISYDGGSNTVNINQTANGGTWRLLASNQPFARGTAGAVRLRNNTGESGRVVVADAVRWVYAAGQDPPGTGAVPAWWAEPYFGGPVPGNADSDNDGYSNYDEYLLGTDPTDPAARLALQIEAAGQDGWRLVFSPIRAGRDYRLLHREDVGSGTWEVATNVTVVTNALGQGVLWQGESSGTRRFFRLGVDWAR